MLPAFGVDKLVAIQSKQSGDGLLGPAPRVAEIIGKGSRQVPRQNDCTMQTRLRFNHHRDVQTGWFAVASTQARHSAGAGPSRHFSAARLGAGCVFGLEWSVGVPMDKGAARVSDQAEKKEPRRVTYEPALPQWREFYAKQQRRLHVPARCTGANSRERKGNLAWPQDA